MFALKKEHFKDFGISMNRKIFNVGMSRSGTKSMAVLMKRCGVRSSHQRTSCIGNERAIVPYDLDDLPKRIIAFLNHRKLDWMYDDKPWFDSSWGNTLAVYPLSVKFPQLRFFVIIRDVESQANSLRYARVEHHMKRNPQKWELNKHNIQQDIVYYAESWIAMYSFLIEQVKKMENKPIIMRFEKYIKGYYNNLFIQIWNMNASPHLVKTMNNILSIRVNTWGDWERLAIPQKYIDQSHKLIAELEVLCEQNWWVCELLNH